MSAMQFTITRTFRASRDELWRAWTDVVVAARWWHPNAMATLSETVVIDLREGGSFAYTMVDPDGNQYRWGGTYIEVDPIDRLRFTWGRTDEASTPLAITVDLADDENVGTTMTFRVEGTGGHPGDRAEYQGWDEAFDILERELHSTATNTTPQEESGS